MALKEEQVTKITGFVKKEPRTVQEISKLIGKSWVTADSYVQQIIEKTGLIGIKTLRKGTQGAVKIVYYNHFDSYATDDVKDYLFNQILNGRRKTDFDFMEVFQFISENKKNCFIEKYKNENHSENQDIIKLFNKAQKCIYCFSGNLSFINLNEKNVKMYDVIENLLKKGVVIKILSRINIATTENLNKLKLLIQKYPNQIEVRHKYQPLRGFLIDTLIARFKDDEQLKLYKNNELDSNTRIFYEINDQNWITWFEKCFWNMFKTSIDYSTRLKEIEKLF